MEEANERSRIILLGRHSKKDKDPFKDQISPEGAALAFEQGRNFQGTNITRVCHTSLVRTAQTAHLFLAGMAQAHQPIVQIIEGIGNDEEFKPICPPEVMALYAGGKPHFEAMEKHFGRTKMKELRDQTAESFIAVVNSCLDNMLVVGHDPFISLIIWYLSGETAPLPLWRNLPEMTTFTLQQSLDGGPIEVMSVHEQPKINFSFAA